MERIERDKNHSQEQKKTLWFPAGNQTFLRDSKGADNTSFKLFFFIRLPGVTGIEDTLSLKSIGEGEKIEEKPQKFVFSRENFVE